MWQGHMNKLNGEQWAEWSNILAYKKGMSMAKQKVVNSI